MDQNYQQAANEHALSEVCRKSGLEPSFRRFDAMLTRCLNSKLEDNQNESV
jgi:hypothetical protein